jgi:hypothetical protein
VLRTSLRLAGERNPLRAPGGCADGCAMPWDRAQANELVARGDWAALLPLLRRDAVTEPDAALFLALILLGKQSSPVQTDPKAAALALCQCIRASFWPQRSAAGSRLATLRIARSALVLFSEVLGLEDVPPGAESSECVDTLNLVLRECGTTEELATAFRSTGQVVVEIVMMAYALLVGCVIMDHDYDRAVQLCLTSIAAFETADRAGNCLEGTRETLCEMLQQVRRLTVPNNPGVAHLEQFMAGASVTQPAHAETPSAAADDRAAPAARACAGCGTTDAVLKKCKGSCRGAGADGRFCSTECAQRSWTAHKKKTGCHKLTKEAAAQGAPAASSPGRAATQAAAAAGSAGAIAAQTRAMQTVIFKAFVYDSHGHQAHFEGAVEVDADLAVAQRDAEAGQRLISYCVEKSTQAVLKA